MNAKWFPRIASVLLSPAVGAVFILAIVLELVFRLKKVPVGTPGLFAALRGAFDAVVDFYKSVWTAE